MTAVSTVLIEARKLIAKPLCWTQGSYARVGKTGRAIGVECEPANCFCAEGAVKRAAFELSQRRGYGYVSPSPASDRLNKVCFDHFGVSAISFNDMHQHGDVIKLFNLAVNEALVAEGLTEEVPEEKEKK